MYNDTENHGVEVEKSNGDMNVFPSLFLFLKGREGGQDNAYFRRYVCITPYKV